jgi:hypothetical protein
MSSFLAHLSRAAPEFNLPRYRVGAQFALTEATLDLAHDDASAPN